MCGIVGYIGSGDIKKVLLDGLKELEYRGYDSAGIAILQESGHFTIFKAVGKLKNLEAKAKEYQTDGFGVGIGHTRWATHGKPTELNAHPHVADQSYVVHNGIIENYSELKKKLQKEGVQFLSQTDTEVIVHLFEKELQRESDAFRAFEKTIKQLKGAYAILLVTKSKPGTIFFAKEGSPLLLAKNSDEIFFASSDAAIIGKAKEAYYFEDGEYGYVSNDAIMLYHEDKKKEPHFVALPTNKLSAQKDGYRFFMEKEIYEQSEVLADTMLGRVQEDGIVFEEIQESFFDGINSIKLCACGTSYHAALVGSYLFERFAKIKCDVEIASEFRYKEPLLTQDTLFVTISQSGETADTLESLKMAKAAGLKSLTICNVDNSSMTRLADTTLLTRAGIEKGVASTKAFATQVTLLWMLALYVGKQKETISQEFLQTHLKLLRQLPQVTKVDEALHERIKRLSKRYLHGHGFFFIGRDIFFPLALEGALKLKEISYLHAEGYPAGEMKHGPIALADPELFTIALLSENLLYEKTKSNIEELSSRDATICVVSSSQEALADDMIELKPQEHYMLEFFEMMVALQLLALEISVRLGNDVDMPRNLAKSVTVE